MPELSEQVIAGIVERVVEIILKREHAVYTTTFANLAADIAPEILTRYGNIVVEAVDANGILTLARCLTEQIEIRNLLHIVSFGARITLVIHPSLCAILPVKALCALPFHWQTSDGRPVYLCSQSVISYSNVCELSHAILVTRPKAIVTVMAQEIMNKNQLIWSRSEDTLWI
ncbi:PduM family microcompartment protein [Vibrio mangrovi]|uniref:PduM family microcompartment protein n=1 Tax=Vibrio mangrovi TaxID=474394 RepID=A0A1Y6J2S8_9VIBR|nr:PduM family microcompartment protein [Vibrio mangrovi]MDW6005177.1 PduM family microcompartment protein [Vibrio mangrovi]SMS02613.1 hypothetical protein VIM7927_03947 [Vibrio mangrovi]